MKKVVMIVTLFLSSLVFANVPANPVLAPASVVIKDGVKTEYVATINVDLEEKSIKVQIWNDMCHSIIPLSPGAITCMAMPNLIVGFKVPITMIRSSCGSTIYAGSLNQMAVDGPLTNIAIQDNSTRTCRDLRPGKVETKIEVTNAWNGAKTQYFMLSKPAPTNNR